jgi:3-hydroxyacyl-CoA dehydrogenase
MAQGGTAWRGADRIGHVAVVGAGLIGSGWVAAYTASGRSVAVYDPAPDAADKVRAHVERCLKDLSQLGHEAAPGALSFHTELAEAVAGADFVQENAPERPDMKAALFAELDRLLPPDVIVASSTSSLPISELAAGCPVGARFVLGHPFNPVHLMPLVELGGGERTDPAAIDTAQAFYVALGKEPVRLNREVFGHIANRLTSAMFREAVSLVASGAANVEDVDKAIRFGPALKWAIQGQFTTFHTSGGQGGLANFLEHFSPGIMKRWSTMQTPDLMDPALRAKLKEQIAWMHNGKTVAQIAAHQDAMLLKLLQILSNSDE